MEHMPQPQTQHLVILRNLKIFCVRISKKNLYAAAKNHKFNSLVEIVEKLKIPTYNFTSGYILVQCS